ncbi:MAG TPA: retropepsin-like aspartic protease [Flavobacterium sp.]|nr:retropepsin-like aspartic protease [Flavobacterium sp.]
MKKQIFQLILIVFFINIAYSQKVIEMEKVNGTYQVPCKVNGIPMKFIFDTGATDVTISITEAKFLIKQGLITKEDFIENTNYQIANGDVIEGTKIYLKTIEIEGVFLKNIPASIIYQQNAPLLLGQSAIEKIGQYTINGNKLIIENTSAKDKRYNDAMEIINWINLQFNENKTILGSRYFFNDIIFIKNQPFLILSIEPGFCENIGICKIPIKKLKPITFQQMTYNSGDTEQQLGLETKNNEEIVWYQNKESNCGVIGKNMHINLNNSVAEDDLKIKIKKAFSQIMMLYGNNGKE